VPFSIGAFTFNPTTRMRTVVQCTMFSIIQGLASGKETNARQVKCRICPLCGKATRAAPVGTTVELFWVLSTTLVNSRVLFDRLHCRITMRTVNRGWRELFILLSTEGSLNPMLCKNFARFQEDSKYVSFNVATYIVSWNIILYLR